MSVNNPGQLTDAQARNLTIKALRQARASYRQADTAGEVLEREFDRLIKRKTRINANSLVTLNTRYKDYVNKAAAIAVSLTDANNVASQF
jgi:hypothetical protein